MRKVENFGTCSASPPSNATGLVCEAGVRPRVESKSASVAPSRWPKAQPSKA
eukprot:CAMPEP_0183467882 /NCGR_PEP_ID=MMETSP0370-20130417/151761_1 /TAXON_ID=268820 /ORGANISM="Peridinium aciculiferum, Strain PAER-2" /LENGTH=51 /DNA_ID=CAMNT_0025660245 /DNA_START=31 /DNA_END=182 /DNA_ORIENTATION=-